MKTISIHSLSCSCKGCGLGYSFPVNLIPQELLVQVKSHEVTMLNYTDRRSLYLISNDGQLSVITGKTFKKTKD